MKSEEQIIEQINKLKYRYSNISKHITCTYSYVSLFPVEYAAELRNIRIKIEALEWVLKCSKEDLL